MKLLAFDCVLILSWSDWDNEPRSNRYHYASRFAGILPVFFFQHKYSHRSLDEIHYEMTPISNLSLVEIGINLLSTDPEKVFSSITSKGYSKPLIWIYDHVHYNEAIKYFPNAFVVYHATENYLLESSGWSVSLDEVKKTFITSLFQRRFDHIVACSPSIKDIILECSPYTPKDITIAPNGCDFEDIKSIISVDRNIYNKISKRPKVVYQGGINNRIDYELIKYCLTKNPDYDFLFFGDIANCALQDFNSISKFKNFHYKGSVRSDELYKAIASADIGLIPFIADPWIFSSLPLKAFEYLACGIPVVSVPIDYLKSYPNVFKIGGSIDEFSSLIRENIDLKKSHYFHDESIALASLHSYDKSFENVVYDINKKTTENFSSISRKSKNLLVLYDHESIHVSCIKEHLFSFEKFSEYSLSYLPSNKTYWEELSDSPQLLNSIIAFDAIIIHYSVRVSCTDHYIYAPLLEYLVNARFLKIVFIQDEYDHVEKTREFLDLFNPEIVFTNIPLSSIHRVYPRYRYPSTKFVHCLTGYSNSDLDLSCYIKSYEQRNLLFAYRGRRLPPYYGKLGQDKYYIGISLSAYCKINHIPHDISVANEDRIYGNGWFEFLGSSVATLVTESGCNIFDETGSFKTFYDSYVTRHPSVSQDTIYEDYFAEYDNFIEMNQISPKVFEAIALRTVIVAYPGSYSNILKPNIHYLPLNRDLSNIEYIINCLSDKYFVAGLTERAYDDIIRPGLYSYRSFVKSFDSVIDEYLLYKRKYPLSSVPFKYQYKLIDKRHYSSSSSCHSMYYRVAKKVYRFIKYHSPSTAQILLKIGLPIYAISSKLTLTKFTKLTKLTLTKITKLTKLTLTKLTKLTKFTKLTLTKFIRK